MEYAKIHDSRTPSVLKTLRVYFYQYRQRFNKDKRLSLGLTLIIVYLVFFTNLFSSGSSNTSSSNISKNNSAYSKDLNLNFKTVSQDLHLKYNKLPVDASLRDKLSYYFPYEPSKPIPNSIWQTWKVALDDPKFPENFNKFQATWDNKNPDFSHYIIPDSIIDEFLGSLFQNIPEIIEAYNLLPKNILKADFFRYLIIFARGGTYSDIDTKCLKPINDWTTFDEVKLNELYQKQAIELKHSLQGDDKRIFRTDKETLHSSAGLIIGIEADPDRPDWADWYARRIQFCQWTIQGKSGHPMLRELIIRIVEQTKRKQRINKLKSVEGKDLGGDIMQWTGPGIFTDSLIDYLNNVISNGAQKDGFGIGSQYWLDNEIYKLTKIPTDEKGNEPHNDKQLINWKIFTGLEEPKLVDDILILPITSFSPDVGQMGAKSSNDPMAFVKHMFEGSWKPESERHIG